MRYYHRVGLLEPDDVDPRTGYRRYTTDQIPVAQVIRRFRDLDMPVKQVQTILATLSSGWTVPSALSECFREVSHGVSAVIFAGA